MVLAPQVGRGGGGGIAGVEGEGTAEFGVSPCRRKRSLDWRTPTNSQCDPIEYLACCSSNFGSRCEHQRAVGTTDRSWSSTFATAVATPAFIRHGDRLS